jgi:hypothetical protein
VKEIIMNRIHRVAGLLAGLACAWLALAVAAPAAFAARYPTPGAGGPGGMAPPLPPIREKHPPLPVQVHTVVIGGMPGWQITLIAAAAALAAATAAVLLDRGWAARRKPATTAA